MKRRLTKIVLLLLLGAIVNVAVAWGCACGGYHKNRTAPRPIEDDIRWWYDRYSQSPVSADDIRWLGRLGWKGTQASECIVFELCLVDYTTRGVQRRGFLEVPRNAGCDLYIDYMWLPFAIQTRVGWPTRALSDELWKEPNGNQLWQHSDGVRFPNLFGLFPPVKNFTVPLRPIWPGFGINTVFYAAILWSLTLGPFTARRIIRRKRGLCINCGYDLRGTSGDGGVCPECGAECDGV